MGNPQEGLLFRPTRWYNEAMISPQYLAGLIDGEGYLGLLPSRAKGLKNPSFEPVVKLGMTGSTVLIIFDQLQEKYGGTIERRRTLTKGSREAYTYVLKSRKKVLTLLNDISPYLIVKQGQALLLMRFCNLPNTHSRYASFDATVLELKVELYEELKRMKQPEPLATTE